uniref:Cytochrome P450 n=1 Tax=Oryza sativa subsp. japonica TaxID=39947 RepID=Q8L520_ORYSJ|nr:Putative cytochrome P450 [Oryza sativa Japonica Group]AAN04180.2 Putative cytochrome P450 [Oryza sativa Japonica Group]
MASALFLWLSWLVLSLLSIYLLDLLAHSRRRLPPGPRPLPLIGSLHLLGDQPHRSLAGLAKTYGPLMSLRLGAVTTVVVSSPDVAREFLQKHDAVFATRSAPDAAGDHTRNSVPWLPPGPRWRELRKIMATELLATHRLDALHELRQEKVSELVDHVARLARDGAAVDVGRVAFTTSLNLLSRTIFSRDLTSLDDRGASKEFQQVVTDIMGAAGSPNLSDFFPALAAADLQGWRRRLAGLFERLHRVFDAEIEHRRRVAGEEHGKVKDDFLRVLLRLAARDDDTAGLDDDTLRSVFTRVRAAADDRPSPESSRGRCPTPRSGGDGRPPPGSEGGGGLSGMRAAATESGGFSGACAQRRRWWRAGRLGRWGGTGSGYRDGDGDDDDDGDRDGDDDGDREEGPGPKVVTPVGPMVDQAQCDLDGPRLYCNGGFVSLAFMACALSLLSVYLLDLLAQSRRRLPPGPHPLPLIGSLHLLGDQPHRSLAGLAKTYGPLMSLRLGAVTTVVVSSPDVAREFLQKHDAVFATRSAPDASGDHARNSVALLPNSPRWRELRKIMATELFSTSRLDALHELRQEKVVELVDHVARLAREGAAVDVGRVAFTTSLNLLSHTIFSRDLTSLDDHGASKEFQQVVTDIMGAAGSPNLSDFFPALAAADLQGWRRRLAGLFERLRRVFDAEIEHRRRVVGKEHGKVKDDFLRVLLRLAARDDDTAGLHDDALQSIFTDLFAAGSDTSSSTVEWAMAELLRNPLPMAKACDELQRVIGSTRRIEESDIGRLPYLQAVIKETFRLHPPVPFLLPRQATTTIQILGYTIPKGAKVFINVWAMGRDKDIWPEAEKFMPERFLERATDFKGADFELIPFGAGRRICPGLPLAVRMVHVVLASLLINFKWRLPVKVERDGVNMTEKFGLLQSKEKDRSDLAYVINAVKDLMGAAAATTATNLTILPSPRVRKSKCEEAHVMPTTAKLHTPATTKHGLTDYVASCDNEAHIQDNKWPPS